MPPQVRAGSASNAPLARYGRDSVQDIADVRQFINGFNASLQANQRMIARSALELAALGTLGYLATRRRR